jgi:hypothetical protein
MDQRSTIGTSLPLDRPIHRACVVAGCWCGSTTTADARSANTTSGRGSAGRGSASRPIRGLDADSTNLTGIAWRFVGLPVV